ncbi:unnamed protein product [Closterium sp. NIES-53]
MLSLLPCASASATPGTGESAAPGAGESALSGTAPTEALHTFTLDSGASRSFFGDSTTLTPLSRPVAISLADPSGGPVLAHSSTVLPCPASPSGMLLGLHLPSFSTNLVSGADLQDAWVDQFAPRGSSLYTLTTASPSVSASGQVAASSQVFAAASRSSPESAPCSCRPLSHETLLWHHRLGRPSLPPLRGMASRTLVSGLPRSLPPLPLGPAPTCVPCVEGRQRAAPHSSTFPSTEAPLQTLHMDAKGEVTEVLIDWIRSARRQLSERFGSDLPVLRLHSDRGARTSMIHAATPHFLWPFAVQYVAHQLNLQPRVSLPEATPTLRWMGKVGDAASFRVWGSRAFVRDTSTDKLSSRAFPCVFLGFPPDSLGWQFYHPTSRRVLSSQDVTFDESVSYYRSPLVDPLPPQGPAPIGVSQVDPTEPVEVAVDSGAARGAEPAGAGTGGAEPGGAEPACAESGGSPGVPLRREPLSPQRLREWYARRCRHTTIAAGAGATGGAAGAGAAGGAAGAGAAGDAAGAGAAGGFTGAGAAGAAGRGGARTGGTGAAGAGGAAGVGAASTGAAGARATGGAAGAVVAGGAGAAGGAAGAGAGAGAAGASGLGGARTGGTGAAGAGGVACVGATGTGAGGATGADTRDHGAEGTGAVSAISGGAARPRSYYVPLLQQVLGPTPPLLSPPPVQSQSQFQPASPLPCPSPYSGPARGLTKRRAPESCPASPESRSESPVRTVCAGRRVSRPRPTPVPSTHSMTLRPSTAPQRIPLPSPPASSLPDGPDPESDSLRAASPTVTRFLATAVIDPLFESTAASALVAKLVDFAAACRLDFATSLVAESASASVCPSSVGGRPKCTATCADPALLRLLTSRPYAKAIEGPYSSQWQASMDAEMASWKSTGTYIDEVPPPGANIVSGMWIFRVKRPPGSPPVFKARYVARGFSQRQGVDFFQTFSPTPKMTTLRVLLHVAAQRDYKLHLLDFSTAFLQGSLHEEIWLRRPPGFTGSFPAGTQWSLQWPVYGLCQAPREWHDTLRTTFAALALDPSTADPSLFLRTDTTLPPFYILVYEDDLVLATADTEALAHVKSELQMRHTCIDLAPPSDESVEPSGPYPELVGYLMYLMTCTRPDLAYPLSLLARYVAPGRHQKVHWDAAKRVLRNLCSTSVMGLELSSLVTLTPPGLTTWLRNGRHRVTQSVLALVLSLGGLPALLLFSV